jgi:2-phosphosulfolactate phosphatase
MKIKIIKSPQQAHLAVGITVVIDVLRAFSTACFVFNNKALKIISVANINKAYNLKKKNPKYILMGERQGLKQPGFDYGNSPTEIKNVNFSKKSVILTTSKGTQTISKAKKADTVLTGAFVNAGAIVKYILKENPNNVSLVCTDNRFKKNEDYMCAVYIKNLLEKKPVNFSNIKKHLENHEVIKGFLHNPMSKFSIKDFHISLSLNLFPFIIKAEKHNNLIYLKKRKIYDK